VVIVSDILFEVFEVCGQPSVGARQKRHATSDGRSAHKAGSAPLPVIRGHTNNRVTSESAPTVGVAEVVHSIRLAVSAAFGFWDQLPRDECFNFTTVSSAENAMCWNGTNLVRYV